MAIKITMKEQIIPFKEFRINAGKYITAMEKGARFLVVKRSRPVFRLEPVDEVWETVGDFSTEKGGGISAKQLLKLLKA